MDIASLFASFGFNEEFSMPEGFIKYVHPKLEIELLVPTIGPVNNKPYSLKNLNSNAQQLRYLDIIKCTTGFLVGKFFIVNFKYPSLWFGFKFPWKCVRDI